MVTNGGTSLIDVGQSADHGQRADATELVHPRAAGEIRPIADGDVAGQHDVIRDDHLVADAAVVGDVGVDHQQAVVADGRLRIGGKGAMDGDVFADRVVAADDHVAGVFRRMDVLGHSAEHRAVADAAVFTEDCAALDRHAAFQDAPGADYGLRFHHAEGADFHIRAKHRFRANQRQRVDTHGEETSW